jgi:DNA polymerase-4
VDLAPEIVAALGPLLDAVDPTPGVRLLGVSGSNLAPVTRQLTLDDAAGRTPDWAAATGALDEIRLRFGASAIGPASALEGGHLRVVRPGEQQWGPQSAPLPVDGSDPDDHQARRET